MSNIDKQALREEFRLMQAHYSDPADRARQVIYIAAEALLDELETKEEQRANWFQMAQKLGEDLDAAEKRNAEQREYYEGVIADGSKRIAELEARTVVVKQFDDFQIVHYGATEDYAKGYIDCQSNYNKAIYAAGIKVKGGGVRWLT
ncbi:ead/Ea22-like family protein [Salmonella enterica]|nr:ead/Ea22-like family protein [Salmonella enterica]